MHVQSGPLSSIAILEPHPDDVALSLGAWLASIAGRIPVDVFVLFSESRWAPYLDDQREAVRARRMAEESRFLGQAGARGRDFGFPDSSMLGFDAVEELRVDVHTDSRLPVVRAALASALPADAFLLVPLGLGNHIDHLVARDSRPPEWTPWACYEELPCACHLDDADKADLARRVLNGPARCWRFDVSGLLAAKRAGLHHYRSQLTPDDIERVLSSAIDAMGVPVEHVSSAPAMCTPNGCWRRRASYAKRHRRRCHDRTGRDRSFARRAGCGSPARGARAAGLDDPAAWAARSGDRRTNAGVRVSAVRRGELVFGRSPRHAGRSRRPYRIARTRRGAPPAE